MFLRDHDKSCHQQHYFLSLFYQALAHSSLHVSTSRHLILIGHFCRFSWLRGYWVGVFYTTCETWSRPQKYFSLGGGIKNWQTQTTRAPVSAVKRSAPMADASKTTSLSVLLQLERTPFPAGHERGSLHFIKNTPHSSLSTNFVSRDRFVVPPKCSYLQAGVG